MTPLSGAESQDRRSRYLSRSGALLKRTRSKPAVCVGFPPCYWSTFHEAARCQSVCVSPAQAQRPRATLSEAARSSGSESLVRPNQLSRRKSPPARRSGIAAGCPRGRSDASQPTRRSGRTAQAERKMVLIISIRRGSAESRRSYAQRVGLSRSASNATTEKTSVVAQARQRSPAKGPWKGEGRPFGSPFAVSQDSVVAGAGFEPATFRL